MFSNWRKVLQEELSGRQAFRYADRIAQFHRIQASTGYREAAEAVVKILKRDGVDAELISYSAEAGSRFLAHRTFQEWHCNHAELWIEGEERKRIARFEEEEISVVQRSVATPPEGIEAELVVVEEAEDPKSYEGLNLNGKIALVRGNQFLIHDLAVVKHGAIGLIFDNLNEYAPIRTRLDMPDAIQYTSFWWQGDEQKAFGFAVSPRVGEELRAKSKQGTVRLTAKVDAKLYDGHYENIEFFIPGKQQEEVLLVSHLCHPYPGGQDNASGPGTLMETMRALQQLISERKLPQPDLGIRFLMMPEMTGTYAYFAQHPERKDTTIAALNLDMVGADQTKGGGPLCIEQPPMATPTFVDRFAYNLFQQVSQNTSNLTGTFSYSTTHFLRTRFSGGSDHYIIADPTIGIPCPMLIQWPDKHYHTTEDSTNNLDPNMMKMVALTTALYAYGLANGSEQNWSLLLNNDTATRYTDLQQALTTILNNQQLNKGWCGAFKFYCDYEKRALESYRQYADIRKFDSIPKLVDQAQMLLDDQIKVLQQHAQATEALGTKIETKAASLPSEFTEKVYKRTYEGPFDLTFELERLPLEERLQWYEYKKQAKPPAGYEVFLQYWIDGTRSVQEVLALVHMESGSYDLEYAQNYLQLCERLGLISRRDDS
ncbi:DUF4910 domain-containing protein [Alkalihalobacterium chitinilyticum]|uniref:DUF4910 domain-containing protein n=1 Tax=Alkalihalobacterium chitinilyticum TaxID=2980103 RepID=A0ABT5VDA7_9BACI|nr:DUF4910 domain-containing protein [Alkalihalobacterium chitinilyticum]MDE5413441.1 DUF4910 domain-containing protein [Alkalihalobacterium chitinilyticum]